MTNPNPTNTSSNPPGLETVSGEIIGRDPRRMDTAELHALGHVSNSVLEAVKAKCTDCCGGEKSEARKCVATGCTLWPFRMGSNPLSRRSSSPEQKVAAKERMDALNASRKTIAA